MAEQGIRCIADVRANVGEAPVWVASEQALYWVDNKGKRVFRLGGDGGVREFATPFEVCCLAPKRSGGFIAGTDRGLAVIDAEARNFDVVANPEPDLPHNRFNDGKTDAHGRFWSGTMDNREQELTGSLYRVDSDLSCTKMDSGYRVTNGPAFDPNRGRMYHTDSAAKTIFAFDLSESGELSRRRVFARFCDGDGSPDGMTVDCDGYIWVCFWDGWCLRRLSPDGEVVRKIDMPVQRPTSCTFGGLGFDRLYITSARRGIDEKALEMQPCAGGLFLMNAGVHGVESVPFAG
ncbi:MAG TPA: SMP-30/gluconolactonase/LRE family protein [Sphingomicrobium sp.]|jgi:sugar lactone lactonase YvrE|nr:SMP-30/gluconolactonase/LRE family protein [Sphingomicrobium sp.]